MKPWQILMIRQCKKNKASIKSLRRIFAHSRGLDIKHCPDTYITHGLMSIIQEFKLVNDWETFIRSIVVRQSWANRLNSSVILRFEDFFLEECISAIAMSALNRHQEYRRPSKFTRTFVVYKDSNI